MALWTECECSQQNHQSSLCSVEQTTLRMLNALHWMGRIASELLLELETLIGSMDGGEGKG